MTASGWFQVAFYLVVLLVLAKPLGSFMARVYQGEPTVLGVSYARSSVSAIGSWEFGPTMKWIGSATPGVSCCSAS